MTGSSHFDVEYDTLRPLGLPPCLTRGDGIFPKQDDKDTHGEPTGKKKRPAEKASPPAKKKKVRGGSKYPAVEVSDDLKRKVIVLNVVGLLVDIRPLHDRGDWGKDLPVHYDHDQRVKIKKRAGCGPFLTMLTRHFDVGIWSPVDSPLLEVVSKFLAVGIPSLKWSFLWGFKVSGRKRNLNDLFSMIPGSLSAKTRCLQFDCEATTTTESPPSNVQTCPRWDPLEPNDDYLTTAIEQFQALSRNPSDIEYCGHYFDKDGKWAAVPRNRVGLWGANESSEVQAPSPLLLPLFV